MTLKKLLSVLAAGFFISSSVAYANKTVELIVSTTPGGSQDLATRQLQKSLSAVDPTREYVVVYKPGAAGSIAYNYATKPNSNNTLVMLSAGAFTEISLTRNLDEIRKEVSLVGPIWTSPGVLVTGANSGINSLEDLIKKGRDTKITCGCSGKSIKLALDYYFKHANMKDPVVVLYKGTQEGMPGLISGETDCWLDGLNGPMYTLHQAGKIKIIASSESRAPALFPHLPSMKNSLPATAQDFNYTWFLTVGIPEVNDPKFKSEIKNILYKAIKGLETTPTLIVQSPETYNEKFFADHVSFVKKITQ